MQHQACKGIFLSIAILTATWLLISTLPQPCEAAIIAKRTDHITVSYLRYPKQAQRVANAAEEIWQFYTNAGFAMPEKIKINIWNIAAGDAFSIPPRHYLTKPRIELIIHPFEKQRDILLKLAHELFHQAMYASLTGAAEAKVLALWSSIIVDLYHPSKYNEAEFWLFFEGLPETMAWLAYPKRAATSGTEWEGEGVYWFSINNPRNCFSDPWRIKTCGLEEDLELLSYKTIPFWLGMAQRTSSGNSDLNYAQAIRRVIDAVNTELLQPGSVPDQIRSGITSYLERFGLSRKDIRDLMTLSAGIERFHDDRFEKYRIGHFRDYELARNEKENVVNFPNWVEDKFSIVGPSPANIRSFATAPTLPYSKSGPRLYEARYENHVSGIAIHTLATFAGVLQGLAVTPPTSFHPINTADVPPGAIEFKDSKANDPRIHPVAVAGLRRAQFDDLAIDFPMRRVKIRADSGVARMALNNFRLSDLSVFRVLGRESDLKYRYTFLGKHGKSLRVSRSSSAQDNPEQTRLLWLDDGEWVIRGVEPTASRHVSVMLTPATIPEGPRINRPCRVTPPYNPWCSDTFDIAERRENTVSGTWSTPQPVKTWTHWYVMETPVPGSLVASRTKARFDIARVEPGNHGGGHFYITAVDHDLDANPMPDLLVRGIKRMGPSDIPIIRIQGRRQPAADCTASEVIKVYITNQGSRNASDVRVAFDGSLSITQANAEISNTEVHQTQTLAGVIRPGESRDIDFVIVGSAPYDSMAGIVGSITLDPTNSVMEVMETNNSRDLWPINVSTCKSPKLPDRTLPVLDDILDELPANPQALMVLQQSLPNISEVVRSKARPLVDWIQGKGPMPEAGRNPHYSMVLDRLEPMIKAGLFKPDALEWFATFDPAELKLLLRASPDAVELRARIDTWVAEKKPAPEWKRTASQEQVLLTPAGLVIKSEDRFTPANKGTSLAFISFSGHVPNSHIVIDDRLSGFETGDGLLPVSPGSHTIHIVDLGGNKLNSWSFNLKPGETKVLNM